MSREKKTMATNRKEKKKKFPAAGDENLSYLKTTKCTFLQQGPGPSGAVGGSDRV